MFIYIGSNANLYRVTVEYEQTLWTNECFLSSEILTKKIPFCRQENIDDILFLLRHVKVVIFYKILCIMDIALLYMNLFGLYLSFIFLLNSQIKILCSSNILQTPF